MLRRLPERAQGWIACLSARAQCKLLGEMVLLPQGLNGTLVRAAETELLPRRCHSRADFREAAEVHGFAPLSDQPFPGSVCVPLKLSQRQSSRISCRLLNRYWISRVNSDMQQGLRHGTALHSVIICWSMGLSCRIPHIHPLIIEFSRWILCTQ